MKAKRWDWAHKKQKNIEVTIDVMILIIIFSGYEIKTKQWMTSLM